MSTNSTERLVRHALDRADQERPDEVDGKLRRHVIDTVSIVVGARDHAASSPSVQAAIDSLAPDGPATGQATNLATGASLSVGHAALVNGTFAHSLDFDDTHRESSLHPGAPVIPAALAVAEREEQTVGEFLDGVRVGYDVACGMGRAVDPDAHYGQGFHITATCGTFGAVLAAGVVAGLDEDELTNAVGVAGSQAAGSLQFLANGAWNKRLHPGLAARRAVTAVALADAGFRGAASPLDGESGFFAGYTPSPKPAELTDLDEREAVLETALKPYPCCRYMHSAIDALTDLAAEVDPAAIETIDIELPAPGISLTAEPIEEKRRPSNFVDCQFSMPFAAALSLTRGEAGLDAFLSAQDDLDDPTLRRLMDATEVETSDAVMEQFPERWPARVRVDTEDGTDDQFVEAAPGEPERPLGWGGVGEKARTLIATTGVSESAVDEFVGTVRTVDADESVTTLIEAIQVGRE